MTAQRIGTARISDVELAEMQHLVEGGELDNTAIARRLGVSERTVRRHIIKWGWRRPPGVLFGRGAGQLDAAESADAALLRQRRDIMALLGLVEKLGAGLERIVDGKAKEQDAMLLTRNRSVIDAFGALAAAQSRLILLHRQTQPKGMGPDDAMEMAARIRAAQLEMAALTWGEDIPPGGAGGLTGAMIPRKDRLDPLAIGLMVLLCALWGTQQIVIKSTNAEIPPALQAGLRSLGATLLVWGWAAARGIRLFRRDGTLVQGVAAGVLFGLEFAVVYWSLTFASASHTVLFLYASPFVVATGAHLFVPGEQLRPVQVLGLCCAFLGVALGLADAMALPDGRELIGDGLALLGALLWGATTVLIKAGRLARIEPAKTLFYQLAVSALLLPAVSLLRGEAWPVRLGPMALASLGYQIVVIAFLSYLAWYWLIRHYPAGRVAAFSFLTPLFGMLCADLLLGEALSATLGLALALVAGGIYLVNRPAVPVAAGPIAAAADD